MRRFARAIAAALLLVANGALVPAGSAGAQTKRIPEAEGGGDENLAVLASPEEMLEFELDRTLRGAVGERATVGAEIRSLTRGEVLYSLNSRRLLQPASNVKLFTVAAALHYLGPDFTFRTAVYGTGPVDGGGVLRGDLVVEGRGDPNLSGRFYSDSVTYVFDRIAAELRTQGVRHVGGDLIGDNGYFEGPELGEGWSWDSQQWWYAAQSDALSFNDNTITVAVSPGAAAGTPARVRTIPETSYVTIVNEVVTTRGRGGSAVSVQRPAESNVVSLKGSVPAGSRGASVIVTVDDPARYTLTILRERLARAGIRVSGQTRLARGSGVAGTRPGATLLAVHASPPLREIVKVVHKRSQNFYAEQLLKTLGAEVRGAGSAEAGIAAVRDFLRREVKVDPGSVYLADGSGLSHYNLVTAEAVVQLLAYMERHRSAREYYDSLVIPGEDIHSQRLNEPLTRGNVHAKTGTVRYTSAYSGYVTAANGERLAFSILVNNRPSGKASAVQLENAVVRALARFKR